MSYIKWNKTLTDYFFNENNKNKEVILYADKTLIEALGSQNNLGNYDDFIKSILIDFNSRCKLYDDIILSPKRLGNDRVKINKELSNKIKEFPNHLSNKIGNFDLVYFNYVIFYITVFVENTEKKSFYNKLNEIIDNYIPDDNNTLPLNGLDLIFNKIEEWTLKNKNGKLGIFRARRLGNLAYLGLLKYQVVLTPSENRQFEEIIYKYHIKIDVNTSFPELANRLLPLIETGKLRDKVIEAIGNLVYAEWFLNRVRNFNHESFKNSEIGKDIKVMKKGQLAFYIDPIDFLLKLKTNVSINAEDGIKNYFFQHSDKDENGYYNESLSEINNGLISFKPICINSDSLELISLRINEVNFFQKTISGGYIQTLTPSIGYEYLVVVREDNNVIRKWENWSENNNNINSIQSISKNENLIAIFGDNYLFYRATDIKKSYYSNDLDHAIYNTSYKDQKLKIKVLGGYLLENKTYIDVALPYFEIVNKEDETDKIKIKVYRNSREDKDILVERNHNKIYLFLNNDIYISETSLVVVKFICDDNFEMQFDFSIVPSKLLLSSDDELFKSNNWGQKYTNENAFFNGLKVSNFHKVKLSGNKHLIENITEEYKFENNYFIYLLTAIFNYNGKDKIKRNDIAKTIQTTLVYLRSRGFEIEENQYSKYNLINNLFALGYINKSNDENGEEVYQLMPPSLIKIEKSFSNTSQVYKLVGARTKLMIQRVIDFCSENNIAIKYKSFQSSDDKYLENRLLPQTIFIDFKGKEKEFVKRINELENIEILLESEYNVGDSLLGFIASISDFESAFLTSPFNFNNQEFMQTESNELPCFVKSIAPSYRNGFSFFPKYLKTSQTTFYKDLPTGWTNLFIQYKKQNPILVLKKRKGDSMNNISPELLIPTKVRLPLIVYKALVSLNHGTPKTLKTFLYNNQKIKGCNDQYFILFDYYSISQKADRQENIVRILTGSTEILRNSQIAFLNNFSSVKNKMFYAKCQIDSDSRDVVIIKNIEDKIVAIGTNNKKIFLNVKFLNGYEDLNSNNIEINNDVLKAVQVDLSATDLNKAISDILCDKFSSLNFIKSKRNLSLNFKSLEEIIIKDIL